MSLKNILSTFRLNVLKPARQVFNAEKPSGSVESAEKPKETGIPIDTEARDAASSKEKQSLAKWEESVKNKYGGQFFKFEEIDKELEGAKSEVYIDAPNMEDEKFKGKEPKVVMYFHGNGGQNYGEGENKKILDEVARRRAAGEPITLVMAQDKVGKWKDFDNPKSFNKIIDHAEELTGKKFGSISLASFSGGYQGIGKLLKGLESSSDPRSKELYKGIKNVGFMDSLYETEQYVESVANWAASDDSNNLSLYWTDAARKGKEMLESKLEKKFSALDKKMKNINIQQEKYAGGHGVDSKFFGEFLDRAPETLDENSDYGLRFSERAPDAMTAEQLHEALKNCKTPQERDQLIFEQVVEKGGVSDAFKKPTIWKTEIKGKDGSMVKVEVPLYGMLRYGEPGNEIIINASGQGTEAIARALGAHLPPGDFYRMLYNDPSIKKAPFWYGKKIEEVANKYTDRYMSYHTKDGKVSGGALQSEEYSRAESDMYFNWCKANNINPDEFTVGHRKTIFMPREQGQHGLTFGGGLHAVPGGNGGWKVGNTFVQVNRAGNDVDFNYTAHEQDWRSMATGSEFIGDPIIDGKRVPLETILTDPAYEHIRPLFSKKAFDKVPHYNIPAPLMAKVEAFQKRHGVERTYNGAIALDRTQPLEVSSTGGIPITDGGTGGGSYSGGGNFSKGSSLGGGGYNGGSFSGGGEYTPGSFSSGPEQQMETREILPTGKVFAIGDSLSHGFVPGFKGVDVTHVHPQNKLNEKQPSVGQHTSSMVKTLEYMLNNYDCEGATLVIVGGSNDLFVRDKSNPLSIEKITKNLSKIYAMAKAAGMKVITSTLPPLAHSQYSERHGKRYAKEHDNLESPEAYNEELIKKWQALNEWIVGQEGTSKGPDKVMQVHKEFEDPKVTGKLRADLYGDGDGVHLANYSEMSKKIQEGIEAISSPAKTDEANKDNGYEQLSADQMAQNAKWRQKFKGEAADHKVVGSRAMEILKDPNVKLGDTVDFEIDGVKYTALKEWHPGNGPHKKVHKGVSVAKRPIEEDAGPDKAA